MWEGSDEMGRGGDGKERGGEGMVREGWYELGTLL